MLQILNLVYAPVASFHYDHVTIECSSQTFQIEWVPIELLMAEKMKA